MPRRLKIAERCIREWLSRSLRPNAATEIPELNAGIATTIGDVRTENQDRGVIARYSSAPGSSFIACILCDGMGGMRAGGECADVAITAMLMRLIEGPISMAATALRASVHSANHSVYQRYLADGGTTLAAALVAGSGIAAASVGDSRIYEFSKSTRIKQVSVDDTIAGELGRLRQTEPSHLDLEPFSHRLAQFVGIGDGMEVRSYELGRVENGATYLLSSDGAHIVGPSVIQSILEAATTTQMATNRILQLSRWYGGKDNATMVWFGDQIRGSLRSLDDLSYSRLELWDSFGKLDLMIDSESKFSGGAQPPGLGSGVAPGADSSDAEQPRLRAPGRSKSKRSSGSAKKASGSKIVGRPVQRTLEIEIVKGSVRPVPQPDVPGPIPHPTDFEQTRLRTDSPLDTGARTQHVTVESAVNTALPLPATNNEEGPRPEDGGTKKGE